jgi:hypothetical protein
MLFNIITSLLTIFITKKICDFTFPIKMENVYLTLGIYGLKVYTYIYIVIQNTSTLFTYTDNAITISLIRNGNEIKECTLDQLKLNIETINTYDLVLYKEKHSTSDKYKYNVLRLNKHMIVNNDFTYNISNIKFIDIQIIYKNKTYNVDFSKDNYYINNNILFDTAFIKWYLNHAYGVIISSEEDYTCTIMDQEINFISLDSSSKIIIKEDGYIVEKNDSMRCDNNITCEDNITCDDNMSCDGNNFIESSSDFFGYISNLHAIDN